MRKEKQIDRGYTESCDAEYRAEYDKSTSIGKWLYYGETPISSLLSLKSHWSGIHLLFCEYMGTFDMIAIAI
jgi:hypothetical protein